MVFSAGTSCKMKPNISVYKLSDSKAKSCLCSLFVTASLICGVYFIGSAFLANDFKVSRGLVFSATPLKASSGDCQVLSTPDVLVKDTREDVIVNDTREERSQSIKCEEKCRPEGSDALPEGIVVKASNLDMRPLWGSPVENEKPSDSKNLLALAVGIKQKGLVNQMVEKFLENGFVVMLFHYDNVIDEWNDLEWSSHVIHVSASNQTKWWFAKRFLHPDIVAEYDYIFLWDEDLGIENFHPGRYLSIVIEEGLEISQPALDPKSEVHHQITARQRRSRVHRRLYKWSGKQRCNGNSTAPPCTGWVEMMAPVFSRAAWRCAWYMIQNDLIHAWGLDMQLGYCAQGDRSLKVGVVDAEYIAHVGLPTLGGLSGEHKVIDDLADHSQTTKNPSDSETPVKTVPSKCDYRCEVRKQSVWEMRVFRRRWSNAVKEDLCWIDPYLQTAQA